VAAPVLFAGTAVVGLGGSANAATTATTTAASNGSVRAGVAVAAVAPQATPPVDIRSSSCPSNIVQGDSGTCVVALQDLLSNWGFWGDLGSGGADGGFGPDTLSAVKAFQTAAGIGVDGQVGPQTKAALYSNAHPYDGIQWTMMNQYDNPAGVSSYWCLDADAGTAGQNGQKIQGWQCLSGDVNQDWDWYAVPNSHNTMIVSAHDGLCLDADTTTANTNGQKIQGWACNGWKNQQWFNGPSSIGDWENAGDSECLDGDTNTARTDGQKIQGWACNGSLEQYWNNGEN
jgi:hypothetical protein